MNSKVSIENLKGKTPLRRYQFERGISNRQLGSIAGIHPVTVSLIATGRLKPSDAHKLRIAEALNVSQEDLFPEAN